MVGVADVGVCFLPVLLSLFFLKTYSGGSRVVPRSTSRGFVASIIVAISKGSCATSVASGAMAVAIPCAMSLGGTRIRFGCAASTAVVPSPRAMAS